MSLFERLVAQAMRDNVTLNPLAMVVEKEILQVESREEILAAKLIALALRPGRCFSGLLAGIGTVCFFNSADVYRRSALFQKHGA